MQRDVLSIEIPVWLETLICSYTTLETLIIPVGSHLRHLTCSHNNIKELCIDNATMLEYLDCSDNYLETFNIPSHIHHVNASHNNLQSVSFRDTIGDQKEHMLYVDLSYNKIYTIDISEYVKELLIHNNRLIYIDIPYSLKDLNISDNNISTIHHFPSNLRYFQGCNNIFDDIAYTL